MCSFSIDCLNGRASASLCYRIASGLLEILVAAAT
jgi:hypothetical protein